MKMRVTAAAALVAAISFAMPALAAPVSVNETDVSIGGDYQNLFLDVDPTNDVFAVDPGANVFVGSIVTPGDPADVILIDVAADETITGFLIEFATNSDDFNPLAINQGTAFIVEEFDDTPLLLTVPIGGVGNFTSPAGFELPGGQLYSLYLGSEVLALLNGSVAYKLTVFLTGPGETPISEVPLPAAFGLLAMGLAGLGAMSRRRR